MFVHNFCKDPHGVMKAVACISWLLCPSPVMPSQDSDFPQKEHEKMTKSQVSKALLSVF